MLFGLLGPVRLLNDPSDPSPGTPKQRALLTALLLNPNRVVPLDRLITALWEDSPPRSATANVRTYVNRLRNRLPGPAGPTTDPERIIASPPGYRIRAAPGELDTLAFAALQGRGRRALRAADPAAAVAALSAAVELWRGAAAEDVPRVPELAPRLDALDEQRWCAVEDLVHARLMLGATTELIADLREFVARHPVRERAWRALMLALYRVGDTSAALDAYHAASRALDQHLGVVPSLETDRLRHGILNRDPGLDQGAVTART